MTTPTIKMGSTVAWNDRQFKILGFTKTHAILQSLNSNMKTQIALKILEQIIR